jgi:predicted transcriptional regulator of viral defense system
VALLALLRREVVVAGVTAVLLDGLSTANPGVIHVLGHRSERETRILGLPVRASGDDLHTGVTSRRICGVRVRTVRLERALVDLVRCGDIDLVADASVDIRASRHPLDVAWMEAYARRCGLADRLRAAWSRYV